MSRSTSGLLQTGLLVLETLCASPAGLGVTELAKEIDADKGNLHRLLSVLREAGYVEQEEASKRYKATVQIVSLAGSMLRSLDLVRSPAPSCGSCASPPGRPSTWPGAPPGAGCTSPKRGLSAV